MSKIERQCKNCHRMNHFGVEDYRLDPKGQNGPKCVNCGAKIPVALVELPVMWIDTVYERSLR